MTATTARRRTLARAPLFDVRSAFAFAGVLLVLLAATVVRAQPTYNACPPAIQAFLNNSVQVQYFTLCSNPVLDPGFTGVRANADGTQSVFPCVDSTQPGASSTPPSQYGYMRVTFTVQLDAWDIVQFQDSQGQYNQHLVQDTQTFINCQQDGGNCGCKWQLQSDAWQALGLGGATFPTQSPSSTISFYAATSDYFYRLGWGATTPSDPTNTATTFAGLRVPSSSLLAVTADGYNNSQADCGLSTAAGALSYCPAFGCQRDPSNPSDCGPDAAPCCFLSNQTCAGQQLRPPNQADIFGTGFGGLFPTGPNNTYVESDVRSYIVQFGNSPVGGPENVTAAQVAAGSGILQCTECSALPPLCELPSEPNCTLRNCTVGGITCNSTSGTCTPTPTGTVCTGGTGKIYTPNDQFSREAANFESWYWQEPTWRVLEMQALPEFHFFLLVYINDQYVSRMVVLNGNAAFAGYDNGNADGYTGYKGNDGNAGTVSLGGTLANSMWLQEALPAGSGSSSTQNPLSAVGIAPPAPPQFQGAFQSVGGVIVLRECDFWAYNNPCGGANGPVDCGNPYNDTTYTGAASNNQRSFTSWYTGVSYEGSNIGLPFFGDGCTRSDNQLFVVNNCVSPFFNSSVDQYRGTPEHAYDVGGLPVDYDFDQTCTDGDGNTVSCCNGYYGYDPVLNAAIPWGNGVPRLFFWAQRGINGFRAPPQPNNGTTAGGGTASSGALSFARCNDANIGPAFIAANTATQNMCRNRKGTCLAGYDWWSTTLQSSPSLLNQGQPSVQTSTQQINDIWTRSAPDFVVENLKAALNTTGGAAPLPNLPPQLVPQAYAIAIWPSCSPNQIIPDGTYNAGNGGNVGAALCNSDKGGGDYRLRLIVPGPKGNPLSGQANSQEVLRVSAQYIPWTLTPTLAVLAAQPCAEIAPGGVGTSLPVTVNVTRTDTFGGTARFIVQLSCGSNSSNGGAAYARVQAPSSVVVTINASTPNATLTATVLFVITVQSAAVPPQCTAQVLDNSLAVITASTVVFRCDTSGRTPPPGAPAPPCTNTSCFAVLANVTAPVVVTACAADTDCPEARLSCLAGFCAVNANASSSGGGCTAFDTGITLCAQQQGTRCRLGVCTVGAACNVATEPYSSLAVQPCRCSCASQPLPPTPQPTPAPTPTPTPAPCSGLGCWSSGAKVALVVGILFVVLCCGGVCCVCAMRLLLADSAADTSVAPAARDPRQPSTVVRAQSPLLLSGALAAAASASSTATTPLLRAMAPIPGGSGLF